jgi:hypothetical protein
MRGEFMTLRNLVLLWISLMMLPAGAEQEKADFSVIPADAYAHEPTSAGAS